MFCAPSINAGACKRDCIFAVMNRSIRITFLLIALVQGLHSIEEYIGKLWEVYPPATYICGLVSANLENGFIIINISLFIVLMLIWVATLSKNFSAKPLLWLWSFLELINGAGHSVWAIMERSYVPGLFTAPILFILALIMLRLLTNPIKKHLVKTRSILL